MEAIVIFEIGDIEIKTRAKVPTLTTIPEAGKKNMTILNAISKIKKELGIDLYEIDEDINEKGKVLYQ